MATVLIAVAAVVVLLVLLALVIVLQRRVRRLDREVALLRSAVGRPPAAGPAARPAPEPDHVRSGSGRGEAVAVITGLQDAGVRPLEEPSFSHVVSVTVAGPMIKVVSLAHGVRRALDEESRLRIGYAFRRELRRQRREQRQGNARPAPAERPPGVWP